MAIIFKTTIVVKELMKSLLSSFSKVILRETLPKERNSLVKVQ